MSSRRSYARFNWVRRLIEVVPRLSSVFSSSSLLYIIKISDKLFFLLYKRTELLKTRLKKDSLETQIELLDHELKLKKKEFNNSGNNTTNSINSSCNKNNATYFSYPHEHDLTTVSMLMLNPEQCAKVGCQASVECNRNIPQTTTTTTTNNMPISMNMNISPKKSPLNSEEV